ncbi:MAG: cyclic nucleotide-binding domain-containing protein [Hyphomicrobiaceae bacterium]|nr:MAG: cyclic nucleotide-binding domain-containing protein [Hyphomicrobiaceae bacterium]
MSQKSPLVVPLLRSPIFQGMDAAALESIAKISERLTAARGQVLARSGDAAAGAILIVNGTARSERPGDNPAIRQLEPGTLIGELAMLVETTFAVTVVAETDMRLMRIPRCELYRLMGEEGRIAAHFAAKIGERLQSLVAEVRQIEAEMSRREDAPREELRSTAPVRVFPPPRPQLPPTYVPDPSKLQLSK